jgi:CHASE1-domain containing sensor protein/putative methionine-R-sulfoxide reductase with GAF domain/HAMP domain-containing protein
MTNVIQNLPVRLKLSFTLGLLVILLATALYLNTRTAENVSQDARNIRAIGNLSALSSRIEVDTQQLAASNANQNTIERVLNSRINENLTLVSSISAFFYNSDQITRQEFLDFTSSLLQTQPEIMAVEYVPLVTQAEREDYETSVQDEGFGNYRITQPGEGGQLIPAARQEEYFPTHFIVPATDEALDLLGFDQASDPIYSAVLQQARSSGNLTASQPVENPLAAEGQEVVLLIQPLYEDGAVPESLEARQNNLTGYLVLVVDGGALVNNAVGQVGEESSIQAIVDATGDETRQTLYANPQPTLAEGIPTAEITVNFLERQWLVTVIQPINTAGTVELQQAATDLEILLLALASGSEELNIAGLEGHSTEALDSLYEDAVDANNTLQDSIQRFVGISDEATQSILQLEVQQNARAMHAISDDMTNALQAHADDHSQQSINTARLMFVLGALVILATLLIAYQIISNLSRVSRTATALSNGQLNVRTNVRSGDEIGQISTSMDLLADRLEDTVSTLEARIDARTQELQAIIDVAYQAATILDVARLLQDVADLTKERFELYHAHIYILNSAGDTLVLTAGAGYTGRQMVAEYRTISMDNQQSIVAQAARARQGIIINDVTASPVFLPHPLLPNTKSELAVALAARGQLLGVLDVQSENKNFFTQDMLRVMDILAAQIAAALSNAQLYEGASQTSRHEQALGQIERRMQAALTVDEVLQVAVRELGKALRVPHTAIELQIKENGK